MCSLFLRVEHGSREICSNSCLFISCLDFANYRNDQTPPVLIIGWGNIGGPPMVEVNQRSLIPAANRSRPVEVANRAKREQVLAADQEARAARQTRRWNYCYRRRSMFTSKYLFSVNSDEEVRKPAVTNKRRKIEEETKEEETKEEETKEEETKEEERAEKEDNSNINSNGDKWWC